MLKKAAMKKVRPQRISDEKVLLRLRSLRKCSRKWKMPYEKVYNLIRKWYVPTKHAGLLPSKAEEMLN